ncbi:hypothetical protein [Deinococcus sp. UYEF24]
MPWLNNGTIIAAATELAEKLGKDPNHTVAAAAMDIHGNVFAGVNNSHFNGGPCAELVVLGMAATAGAGPLALMVAVGDRNRGVIAPCGRCRQVILDQHPSCSILVPSPNGVLPVPVLQLLPYAYVYPGGQTEQFLRFDGRDYDDVISGRKIRTVRYLESIPQGHTTFVFEDSDRPGFRTLYGVVENCRPILLSDLDSDNQAGLRRRYPFLPENVQLEEVHFRI